MQDSVEYSYVCMYTTGNFQMPKIAVSVLFYSIISEKIFESNFTHIYVHVYQCFV